MTRLATRAAVSLLIGAAVAALYMEAITTRFDRTIIPRPILEASVYLDTVAGFANHFILPPMWASGMSLMFREGTYCFPDSYWVEYLRYVRVATVANGVTICALWSAAVWLRSRRARRETGG